MIPDQGKEQHSENAEVRGRPTTGPRPPVSQLSWGADNSHGDTLPPIAGLTVTQDLPSKALRNVCLK